MGRRFPWLPERTLQSRWDYNKPEHKLDNSLHDELGSGCRFREREAGKGTDKQD